MVANVVRDSKAKGSRFVRASLVVSLSPLCQKVPELSIKTSTDASVICPQSVHFMGKITPGGKKHPSGWYSFSTGKFLLPRPAAPGGGPEQSPGTGPAGSGR